MMLALVLAWAAGTAAAPVVRMAAAMVRAILLIMIPSWLRG
jgi:hypothetical protein